MSRRIAHRPRYRHFKQLPNPSLHSRKEFFQPRWTYRRLVNAYKKQRPPLGQGLLLTPVYQFVHSIGLS